MYRLEYRMTITSVQPDAKSQAYAARARRSAPLLLTTAYRLGPRSSTRRTHNDRKAGVPQAIGIRPQVVGGVESFKPLAVGRVVEQDVCAVVAVQVHRIDLPAG